MPDPLLSLKISHILTVAWPLINERSIAYQRYSLIEGLVLCQAAIASSAIAGAKILSVVEWGGDLSICVSAVALPEPLLGLRISHISALATLLNILRSTSKVDNRNYSRYC